MPIHLASPEAAIASTHVAPFIRGAKPRIEPGSSYTPGFAGKVQNKLPTNGWLRGFVCQVQASGGSGTATVAKFEDAPYSIIANLLFSDPSGTQYANLTGYQWYLVTKYGGFRLYGFDGSVYGFQNVVTGANASGNFNFYLPFYAEFGRDGLGCLANQDSSAQYNTNLVLASGAGAALGPVYTTAPTNLPTITVAFHNLERSAPLPIGPDGRPQATMPPAVGTTQYATVQTFTVNSGSNTLLLNRVGNYIRAHILVFRAADGTRATAESTMIPTVIEFDWDTEQRYIMDTALARNLSWQVTGFDAPNGVVPFVNADDALGLNLADYGDHYLPTTGSTKLQLKFTAGAAGTLDVITIDVEPVGDFYAAPELGL